jgi:L-lactate dehydrogenase (cytochrome)
MTQTLSVTRLSRVVNIDDLRERARCRVPRIVFNYIDGGAEGEWTLRENRRAFDSITFRPHQAVAVPACDLRTRVLGTELSMPLLLAPVGYLRVMHPDGEIAAARAAGRAGVGFILFPATASKM